MEPRSSRQKRIRQLKRVALALAVAGIAAPTAQAYYPSEGLGVSAAPADSAVILGENKAEVRGIAPSDIVVRGDDKTGLRDVGNVPVVAGPTTDTARFAWRDAGIGAAGAFVLALLGASAMIALRRGRKSGLATA
jgi:hypothetical protein